MSCALPDDFYEKLKPRLHRRIAQAVGRGQRVVDLGCGDCKLAVLLSRRYGFEVTGIDLSDASFPDTDSPVGRGRHRVHCIKTDAKRLRFVESRSVDAVVSVWALHEMESPSAVLREALRILRPGGRMLIVDFPKGSLAQRLWNENYYTPNQIRRKLVDAGFVDLQCDLIERDQLVWACGRKRRSRDRHALETVESKK